MKRTVKTWRITTTRSLRARPLRASARGPSECCACRFCLSPMTTLFISNVFLCSPRPDATRSARRFQCQHSARGRRRVPREPPRTACRVSAKVSLNEVENRAAARVRTLPLSPFQISELMTIKFNEARAARKTALQRERERERNTFPEESRTIRRSFLEMQRASDRHGVSRARVYRTAGRSQGRCRACLNG